jgi:hypothetical protein
VRVISHAPTPVSPPAHHRTRRLLAPASSSGSRGAGAYHQSLSAPPVPFSLSAPPEVEAPKSISSRLMPWLPSPTPSRWVATRSHSTHAPLIPSIRAHVHPFSLLLSPQFERHGHPVIRAQREHALSQPPCSAAAAALARHGIAPAALARCGRHRPRVTELSDYSSTWL